MKIRIPHMLFIGVAITSIAGAQNFQRQANITGGGSPDRGKCTIEVVVDGVAQIEIRGANATIRNLSGQPAQWRRFECTGVMPTNPADFRFQGVDGRGRQTLVRDPRQGGVAVVEIEDKEGGAQGYTFDVIWDSRGGGNYNPGVGNNAPVYRDNRSDPNQPGYRNDPNQPGYRPEDRNRDDRYRGDDRNRYGDEDGYRPNSRDTDYYRRYGHGFRVQEATRVCEQEIMRQAAQRFRATDIHIERTRIDDQPGREDWIVGTIDVHRGPRFDLYRFACSVNFENGRVRTAQLDPQPINSGLH